MSQAQPQVIFPQVIFFDTTLRDGELMPGISFNVAEKIEIAKLLQAIGVDVIEVGYPGVFAKDFEEMGAIAQHIHTSVICGLASSKPQEIEQLALALKPATRARIHVYTPVNLSHQSALSPEDTLTAIQNSITLARNHCADIEWSAFDAGRSNPDFLCRAVETAIQSGATTISIPDSMGTLSSQEFSNLIHRLFNRVSNLEQAILSVHCHNDLGLAVENSIAALQAGARQIECSINGLGARKGNADIAKIAESALANHYAVKLDTSRLQKASALVSQFTQR